MKGNRILKTLLLIFLLLMLTPLFSCDGGGGGSSSNAKKDRTRTIALSRDIKAVQAEAKKYGIDCIGIANPCAEKGVGCGELAIATEPADCKEPPTMKCICSEQYVCLAQLSSASTAINWMCVHANDVKTFTPVLGGGPPGDKAGDAGGGGEGKSTDKGDGDKGDSKGLGGAEPPGGWGGGPGPGPAGTGVDGWA